MTPEEIQAIRDKYKYNPATLNTGSNNLNVNKPISLSDFGSSRVVAPEKTVAQKAAGIAGEIVKPFERVGGAVQNIAGTAINAASEALGGQANPMLSAQGQRQGVFGNQVDSVGYRDGQQLQGGELAKDITGTILDVGSFAVPVGTGAKVLTKVAKGVQAGAGVGALAGVGRGLQEGETLPEALGQGVVGAVGGAVLGGAIPGVVGGAVGLKNKLNPSEKFIESKILKEYTKGVKPLLPGKSTPATLANYNDNVVTAVKTIKNNKANLSFENEAGDIITGKTPENLNQLTNAVEQTKKKIFGEYDALAKTAGKAGVKIDVNPIAKELDSVINDKALSITNPNAINHAQQLKDRLIQTGSLDAQTAQDVIQNYNKSLEAFYRNPSYENASNAAIDSVVANNMRKALDEGITGLTGTEYQALKSQYGALKSIEKDVIKASLRDARKNTKGLIDFTDIFSGGQVVHGILSMNPASATAGLSQKAIASIYKHLNDPNRAVAKMFEAADTPVGGLVKKLSKSPRGMINLGGTEKLKVTSADAVEVKTLERAKELLKNIDKPYSTPTNINVAYDDIVRELRNRGYINGTVETATDKANLKLALTNMIRRNKISDIIAKDKVASKIQEKEMSTKFVRDTKGRFDIKKK